MKRAREPSERTTSSSWTCSIVEPYTIEWLPDELLPIMPPIVARLKVEVSGPKPRPRGCAARLRSSCTTPGSTRARSACGSSSRMAFMWRDVSSTMPCPVVWPDRLVPAPRVTTGTSSRAAT